MKLKVFFAGLILVFTVSCHTGANGRKENKKVKNIVLFIGDGMGLSHISAAMKAADDTLEIEKLTHTGFSKTSSSNRYITDSGAAATAISTGKKTYNNAIGVDQDTVECKTILEYAEENGLATGLISTSGITHATPASFIAHQRFRSQYEDIAKDFLATDIDVVIGGARNNFNKRADSIDLLNELKSNGYQVYNNISDIKENDSGKLYCLTHEEHPPSILNGRGNMLADASNIALTILKNNEEGFFLLIEGSQIDWEAHGNNTEGIIEEILDFDRVIGMMLDYARSDGNTLVIVTADHETGGMTINGTDINGQPISKYTTTGHTPVMVPVFAFGPGSDEFSGVYENTAIFDKMMKLYGFTIQ